MRFTPQFLDDVRARLPVSQVVGRRVRLKRAGREWKACCPFHKEKTPSFTVNDQKDLWHCFGCGKSGDQFTFMMEADGLTFPEAVEALAEEAGLQVPQSDPQAIKREARRLSVIEVLEAAQRHFVASLKGEPREYLTRRGITPAAIAKFGIGYAANLNVDRGDGGPVPHDLLRAAGLLAGSHDRFRGRITIPIRDGKGRVVGFGGRSLDGVQPKYLNSPDTDAFSKGSLLYNAHGARGPAHAGEPLLVQEGYFDVIQSVMAGFPATVGTMGTALTADQLLALWRMSEAPVLCFDGDEAGRRAMDKVTALAFPLLVPGRTLRFAVLPAGMDPEDLIREQGVDGLRKAVTGALRLADVFWLKVTKGRDSRSPDDLGAIEADMMEAFGHIPDRQLRDKYIADARRRIGVRNQKRTVVRSNGGTNHSASPGALRLSQGMQADNSFSLREAALLIDLAEDRLDLEQLPCMSAKAMLIVDRIASGDDVASSLSEAKAVLRNAGISV